MSSKINIAVAIPTFNRLDKLQFALQKIEAQELDERFTVTCVISNIASQDGTTEFLDSLKSNKIRYVIWNTPQTNIVANWHRCAQTIPVEIDWVWFHGDDDYLANPQVIKGLVEILLTHGDTKLSIVHACQGRRSQNSGKIIRGNLFDLCNQIGYHEILGWMSSLVVRKDKFVSAIERAHQPFVQGLQPDELLEHKVSAYRHSFGLLEECVNDDALFVDLPWVEPQDNAQTEESMKRWSEMHEGERYFYVVDDILSMYERGIIQKKCSPMFFRYLTYSFWDRYAAHLVAAAVQTGKISGRDKEHWTRIKKIGELFAIDRDKKLFLQWYESLSSQISHFEKLHDETLNLKRVLIEQYNLANSTSYPFQVLGVDGNLLR